MRILFVNNFFGPFGGAELSTYLTYEELRKDGHDVFFFATDRKPFFEENYKSSEFFPKHTDYDDPLPLAEKILNLPKIFYNIDVQQKFEIVLKRTKPDIVHCGNIHYHLTPSILDSCRKHNIPVVLTIRDVRLMCPAGTLMLRGDKYCEQELCIKDSPLHCIKHRCYEKSMIKSFLVTAEFYFRKLHKLYDSVDTFIAPSQAMFELAIRSGIPKKKLTVLNNFIDDSFLNIKPRYDSNPYFLYVGRLSKEKGVSLLIRAMANLPREASLHIVGEGPDEVFLKELTLKNGLTNVFFKGYKQGDALLEEYQGALASIVPSNWFENFSRTVIESIALGKPVVGSDVGGIQEVIEHNVNGFIFERGNLEALTIHLKRIHENPAVAIEMGKNAKEKAIEKYNSNIYFTRIIDIYNQALHRKARL